MVWENWRGWYEHYTDCIVVENGRHIFGRKLVSCVADQKTCLADRTVAHDNTSAEVFFSNRAPAIVQPRALPLDAVDVNGPNRGWRLVWLVWLVGRAPTGPEMHVFTYLIVANTMVGRGGIFSGTDAMRNHGRWSGSCGRGVVFVGGSNADCASGCGWLSASDGKGKFSL